MKKTGFIIAAAASTALFGQNFSDNYQFAVASPATKIFTYSSSGPVVTGRPYSATEERHTTQTLGDGTHIETSETNRVFRDEQGRTRIERKDGTISIHDPVEGLTVELDPATKTATKMVVARRAVFAPRAATADEKTKLDNLKTKLDTVQQQYSDKAPQVRVLSRELEKVRAEEVVTDLTQADAYRQGVEAGQLTVGLATAGGPGVRGEAGTLAYTTARPIEGHAVLRVEAGNNGSVESLAPQMVSGVLAAGTRTTETIPVGKIGNDRVINIVNERWYSDALQLLIKSSSSDPRFGATTYELTNVMQTAPDPSLFQIPPDYSPRGLR